MLVCAKGIHRLKGERFRERLPVPSAQCDDLHSRQTRTPACRWSTPDAPPWSARTRPPSAPSRARSPRRSTALPFRLGFQSQRSLYPSATPSSHQPRLPPSDAPSRRFSVRGRPCAREMPALLRQLGPARHRDAKYSPFDSWRPNGREYVRLGRGGIHLGRCWDCGPPDDRHSAAGATVIP